MPQYLSTDPNAGQAASRYLSTDPNAGAEATGASPATRVADDEPGTWLGGYGRGLKEQFAPSAMLERGIQGARGVARGATDLINPLTWMETAEALPGFLRTMGNLPATIADEGVGPTLTRGLEMAEAVASDPYSIGRFTGAMASPGVARSAIGGARAIPVKNIVRTGGRAAVGAAKHSPIVGPMGRGAFREGRKAWKEYSEQSRPAGLTTGPPPAPAPAIAGPGVAPTQATAAPASAVAGPAPKPKLSAQETAAYLRDQFGSERAGRMLYGKGRGRDILSPAERQAAIKRLAPGESAFPQQAQRQIAAQLEQMTPEEAFAYAQKAPNALAREHFGGGIRKALFEMLAKR